MKKRNLLSALILLCTVLFCVSMPAEAKSYKTYEVSVSTKPCNKNNVSKAKKDPKAKTTYMLRSYMEKIDKKGGGTLVLRKGTYKIYENLFVPSNITIKFEKGAKIVAQNRASLSGVFQLISPSKTKKKNSAKGYKSSKNVKFIGTGNTVIDLGKSKATAIYMAHNDKVEVSGIKFKKSNSSRYIIELLGVRNVKIDNCNFEGKTKKENAISVDIPAKKKQQTRPYIKMDDTVNKDVSITNCNFNNLNRAVATLRYVDKKYHMGFKLDGNTMTNIKDDAVRVLNWKDFSITNNTLKTVGQGGTYKGETKNLKRGIYLAGAQNPTITGNTFEDLPRAIELNVYKNTDSALKKFAATKNKVTAAKIQEMLNNNTLKMVREYTIRVYKSTKDKNPAVHYYKDDTRTYTIRPNDIPYRNEYTGWATYNKYTRQYYVFRAVMDQIERNNAPCTIVVKAGEYNITHEFPVANNVTIQLEDGVVVKKASNSGIKDYPANSGIFTLVEPKHYNTAQLQYSGYNGVHDVKILGPENGTAVIDNQYYNPGVCIIMAHSKNVEIRNLTFKNMNTAHFIELDASQNVTIADCTFIGHKDSTVNNKEAINLDTPDRATGGFSRDWTTYDKTANDNIVIANNKFIDLECGVGSHSYSEGKPHKNIRIEGNCFENCDAAAIMIMNWQDVVISNNTMQNVGKSSANEPAVWVNGLVSGFTFTGNTVDTASRVAVIAQGYMPNRGAASAYKPVPNRITTQEKNTLMTTNTFRNIAKPVVYCYDQTMTGMTGEWK